MAKDYFGKRFEVVANGWGGGYEFHDTSDDFIEARRKAVAELEKHPTRVSILLMTDKKNHIYELLHGSMRGVRKEVVAALTREYKKYIIVPDEAVIAVASAG